MDETMMVLLTGLIGTVLGAVLIGGAMAAAFMIGRARGRREALEERPPGSDGSLATLEELERSHRALRAQVDLLSTRRRLETAEDRSRVSRDAP